MRFRSSMNGDDVMTPYAEPSSLRGKGYTELWSMASKLCDELLNRKLVLPRGGQGPKPMMKLRIPAAGHLRKPSGRSIIPITEKIGQCQRNRAPQSSRAIPDEADRTWNPVSFVGQDRNFSDIAKCCGSQSDRVLLLHMSSSRSELSFPRLRLKCALKYIMLVEV